MKDREKQIDELRAVLFEKSSSANVEPVFTDENGEEHTLPDGAIKVLNDIFEKAFIPFVAEVVIDNGYRKVNEMQTMPLDELKAMFLDFMQKSSDDFCAKCAYCETTRCAREIWGLNDEGDLECQYPERYATEPCIEGLYERYKANQK